MSCSVWPGLALAASILSAPAWSQPQVLLPATAVRVEGGFWGPRLAVITERTIPHSWAYMGWELRALEKANGREVTGDLNGTWGEANLYKFIETIAYSLARQPDPVLEQRVDDIVRLVAGAQRPDGYVHAYITNSGKPPWDPEFLDGAHDGYVLGHLIEAALEYHSVTGKTALLEVARRAADQAWEHFLGPAGKPGFCGHAELEMALVELHRETGEARYLDLARAFVEWRGRGVVKAAGPTPRAYFQDQVPLREQVTLEGHAVRAIFFATGVADLALATGDSDYRLAANRFWDSAARRRMYVTGSVGSRAEHEAFGEDYELPQDGYTESCAACGLADFAQRMLLLERRGEYADVLERVLYNAVLHGLALDGTTTYYRNPLSDREHPRDNCWVCCPPNLSRTVLQAGRYAYAAAPAEVTLNLFVAGTATVALARGPVSLAVATAYPWEGNVQVTLTAVPAGEFALNLRLPGWCREATLQLNGTAVVPLPRDGRGYLRLARSWSAGDRVDLQMAMPVERLEANPNVQSCSGRVALQRGPLVYGFEGVDNDGNLDAVLARDPQFQVEPQSPDVLGGVARIKARAVDGRTLVAVPFYALANRGASCQEVWLRQDGWRPTPTWWEGRLYRPWTPPGE
jgi:DUF1680 family protein